jgi:mono/diheme cytochrome c family protein
MHNGWEQIKVSASKKIVILSFLILSGLFPTQAASENCPQERKTKAAPSKFLNLKNPLPADSSNIKAGEDLYQGKARPIACKFCHGIEGNGVGDPDFESTPPARNFACTNTMKSLSDGQLFWVIKNGSKNTSMFAFSDLSDNQVWQLIHYIRQFAQ